MSALQAMSRSFSVLLEGFAADTGGIHMMSVVARELYERDFANCGEGDNITVTMARSEYDRLVFVLLDIEARAAVLAHALSEAWSWEAEK